LRRENEKVWLLKFKFGIEAKRLINLAPLFREEEVGAQRRVRGEAVRRQNENLSGRKVFAFSRPESPSHVVGAVPGPSPEAVAEPVIGRAFARPVGSGFDLFPQKSGER
jgi:hypothetical protein